MNQSELLKSTRQYFWDLGFTEVEPKYLNESLPLEPNLYSFETIWRSLGTKYYLPTSPELSLKKHLSSSPSDCFAIGHCFRDLEDSNSLHTPEFLMLEWYEVDKSLADIQKSVKNFISHFLNSARRKSPWGIEFLNLKLPMGNFSCESDFNQFFLNEIEPKLPRNKAVFITGYPAFLSPLAQHQSDAVNDFIGVGADPRVRPTLQIAQRFELYINGIEIANACTENRHVEQIRTAFQNEQKYRFQNKLPTHPISKDFIKNCGLIPPCSGIGLGLDRLLMLINQKNKL